MLPKAGEMILFQSVSEDYTTDHSKLQASETNSYLKSK